MSPENKPLVSVIVPVYNDVRYLSECLESIGRQTEKDIEVIVVDDGSDDGSDEIWRKQMESDSRFMGFIQPHSGLGAARNKGIEEACGEYIVCVDADDYLAPNALELMLATARDERADVVLTKISRGSALSDIRGAGSLPQPIRMDYLEAIKRSLYQKPALNSLCGVLIKRSLIGNKRMREGILYEDLDAFYRFYDGANKIVYLDCVLYYYRPNSGSIIGRWDAKRLDVLDVTDRLLEYMKLNYPVLEKAAADRRFSAYFNMLLLLLRHDRMNGEAISRCYEVIKSGRRYALRDRNVRLKNKLGALISYFGLGGIKLLSKIKWN